MKRALVVFMKAPEPGRCKTRLCPPLSAVQAAGLYRAFCRDVLETARGAGADLWIAYEPSPAFPTPGWAAGDRFFVQRGETLGHRLIHAFDALFGQGYGRVAAIGTDAPALPPERLTEAFGALEMMESVFGPALDGGYYLVGLSARRPDLFRGIPWSTDRVMEATRAALARDGVTAAFLPREADVDTAEDLWRLARELDGSPATRARATRAALAALRRKVRP
jgi:rSAM/selenodomain-associated transferase 1